MLKRWISDKIATIFSKYALQLPSRVYRRDNAVLARFLTPHVQSFVSLMLHQITVKEPKASVLFRAFFPVFTVGFDVGFVFVVKRRPPNACAFVEILHVVLRIIRAINRSGLFTFFPKSSMSYARSPHKQTAELY